MTGHTTKALLTRERLQLLSHLHKMTVRPMLLLSLVWVVLTAIQLIYGPRGGLLLVTLIIWAIFVVYFILELLIAPHRWQYVQHNWLTAVSLLLPALGLLRLFQVIQLGRTVTLMQSASLARIIAAINRGLSGLQTSIENRGIQYVVAVTIIVAILGAAGIFQFENPHILHQEGITLPTNATLIRNYGDALWWTMMMLTTVGSDYWPHTVGGRILTLLLALYGFAMFGYITANIASLFIGKRT